MLKDNRKMRIAPDNMHLLDIFTDNYYIELGNIHYSMWTRILKNHTLRIDDFVDFNIQNKGIGASKVSDERLQNYLPYLNFLNIYKHNQTFQLFLTYGLVKFKNENHKEIFAPIVLVPVTLFLENNALLIRAITKPLENIVLINYLKAHKIDVPTEKLDSIYNIDKYCLNFKKYNLEYRLENYLTFAKTIEPPIIINHDRYSLKNKFTFPLGNRYYRDDASEIYNITMLNNRQRMAVQRASYGNSFAINGALGTGKTTTLINIASDAIKRNKHILYVSNMKETLDYVEEVFAAKGLKFLVNNLTNTSKYDIAKSKTDNNDITIDNPQETKKTLKKVYDDLDTYEKFLSGRINNFRFLDVIKELLNLEVFEEDVVVDDLTELYKFEYEKIINSLYRIEEAMKKIEFKDSKFNNIPINNNIKYPNQVTTLIFQIHKYFEELKECKEQLETDFGFKTIPNYAKFKNVIANIKQVNLGEIPDVWKESKLEKYYQARNLYPELKKLIYALQEYQLYLDWEFADVDTLDIDKTIKNLLGDYFTEEDGELINKIIEQNNELINKVKVAIQNYRSLNKNIERIKNILDWHFDNNDDLAIKEIIRLIDFLDSGVYHHKWLNKAHHEATRQELVKIQEVLNHYIYLEKEYSKFFNNPNEVEMNIDVIKKMIASGKIIKKFRNVDLEHLLQDIIEYRDLKAHAIKCNKMHVGLTGFEYSPAYNSVVAFDKFVDYLNGFTNFTYEAQITKFLSRVSENDLDAYLHDFNSFRRSYQIINSSYEQISAYIPKQKPLTLFQKGEFLNQVYKYLTQVRNINIDMQAFDKSSSKFIAFETYLKLRERLNHLKEIRTVLYENKVYADVFGSLYHEDKTNINEIGNLLKQYSMYVEVFNNEDFVVKSLSAEAIIGINQILAQASSCIQEINDSFKLYSKIFKDGVGSYYYDEFQDVINYLEELLHAKDDLINYLEITENLKILNQYKLYNLVNYIINNNATNIVKKFKYKYYHNLYKLYLDSNKHNFTKEEVISLLEQAVSNEELLMDYHVNSLQALKSKYGDANANKALYLTTTPILNYFLDYRKFDLILIDDAHLLDANQYYNAVNGKQVIIAGEEISHITLTSTLISRMRPNYTMTLNYRYSPTPLHLLSLISDLQGTFISKVSDNYGVEIISRDVSKYLANLFINNENLLVNYFTSKLETKFKLNQEITQILIDNHFSTDKIMTILRKQLNIVDLFDGYVYDADYNILDLQDYYLNDNELLSLNNISALLTCQKQLVIIDNDNILRKETNTQFMQAIAPILKNSSLFNQEIVDVQLKLASELNKFGIIVHGTIFGLDLVLERNNTYYGVLLFTDPDNAHIDLVEDYREYYEVCKKNNMKVLIIWILDLVRDFSSVVNYLNQETLS